MISTCESALYTPVSRHSSSLILQASRTAVTMSISNVVYMLCICCYIYYLINKLSTLVCDLDLATSMSSEAFKQKLCHTFSFLIFQWCYFRPLWEQACIAVMMCLFPPSIVSVSGPMRSTPTVCHTSAVTGSELVHHSENGITNSCIYVYIAVFSALKYSFTHLFALWQVSHDVQKSFTSSTMPSQ